MTQAKTNDEQIAFWNGDAGAKWATGQDRIDAMLASISAELMRTANPSAGETALDIGCGCGDTSIELARLGAKVTGVDISAPMLARARERAPAITFIEADAAHYRFDASFDLLFSRFGVMFFSDSPAAFANLRRALKPGGRLAFACWRDWRENEWVRVPLGAVRPHVPPQPPVGPDEPGPFAFADLGRVRGILATAGFDEITARPFDAPLAFGANLEESVTQLQQIGPSARLIAGGSHDEQIKALAALRNAIAPYATRSPVTMGGAVWLITART
jgi:SAM-dependent methyltransferase